MRNYEPRSTSSCAACKLLKRRCIPDCLFAPYFCSDEPKKFAKVHKVFGASNVSKILIEVPEQQRQETVNSLAYEAEVRLIDPVYGCIGAIATLQSKMVELQFDLAIAKAHLARYATTSGSSASVFYDHVGNISSLDELSACGGFVDSFRHDNSSELLGQDGLVSNNDFNQFPFAYESGRYF